MEQLRLIRNIMNIIEMLTKYSISFYQGNIIIKDKNIYDDKLWIPPSVEKLGNLFSSVKIDLRRTPPLFDSHHLVLEEKENQIYYDQLPLRKESQMFVRFHGTFDLSVSDQMDSLISSLQIAKPPNPGAQSLCCGWSHLYQRKKIQKKIGFRKKEGFDLVLHAFLHMNSSDEYPIPQTLEELMEYGCSNGKDFPSIKKIGSISYNSHFVEVVNLDNFSTQGEKDDYIKILEYEEVEWEQTMDARFEIQVRASEIETNFAYLEKIASLISV